MLVVYYFVNLNKIENIDFIKIDVEGIVMDVLDGSKETLKKHKLFYL